MLRHQVLKITARTYRTWKSPTGIAARTVTGLLVDDKDHQLDWTVGAVTGRRKLAAEGLHGRRKTLAAVRRQHGMAETSFGAVDRAMRT